MASNPLAFPLQGQPGVGTPARTDALINEVRALIPSAGILPPAFQVTLWTSLRDLLHSRFQRTGVASDLNAAISAARNALRLGNTTQPSASDVYKLAFMQTSLYDATSAGRDLEEAIMISREAMGLSNTSDPMLPAILNNLSYTLSARYQSKDHGNDLADLDQSIELSRRVLQLADPGSPQYVAALSNLSARLVLKSQATYAVSDTDEALRVTRQCAGQMQPWTFEHAIAQHNLGRLLLLRYEQTEYWRDIEEGIRVSRLACETLPPGSALKPKLFWTLAKLWRKKYERTLHRGDLVEVVNACREAAIGFPASEAAQSQRGFYLLQYVCELKNLMELCSEGSVVEAAFHKASEIVQSASPVYAEKIEVDYTLGQILSRKYLITSNLTDLSRLVLQALSVALQINSSSISDGQPARYDIEVLRTLETHVTNINKAEQDDHIVLQMIKVLHKEYTSIDQKPDFIDRLIALERGTCINVQIVSIYKNNSEALIKEQQEKAKFATSLGASTFQLRIQLVDYVVKQEPGEDKSQAMSRLQAKLNEVTISNAQTAVKPKQRDRAKEIVDLAEQALIDAQTPDKLHAALEKLNQLVYVHLPIEDISTKAFLLEWMASLLLQSFEETGRREELEEAVAKAKENISIGRSQGDSKPSISNFFCSLLPDLAAISRRLYITTGESRWLDDALVIGAAAVEATREKYPAPRKAEAFRCRNAALNALANALKSKYQLDGGFENLERAIGHCQQAMQLDGANAYAKVDERAATVNQLALMLRLRYLETGESNDLNTAIKTLETFFKDYRGKGAEAEIAGRILFSNLALIYHTRYERTGDLKDVEQSIRYGESVLTLECKDPQESAGAMVNLATAYLSRYKSSYTVEDIQTAKKYASQAADLAWEKDLRNVSYFLDPAAVMRVSYIRTRDVTELEKATRWMGRAVSLLPPNHSSAAVAHLQHGELLRLIHDLDPSPQSLQNCIDAYSRAAKFSGSGRAVPRLTAARSLYRLLYAHNRHEEALEQMNALIEHMGDHLPRWLPAADRQHIVSIVHGLPSDTAAAVIALGGASSAYRAVRALELSRGILLGSVLDYRSEAKLLAPLQGDLLARWNQLCMELDAQTQAPPEEEKGSRRQFVHSALVKCVEIIRQIPGFEAFVPPLDLGSLRSHQLREAFPQLYETYNHLQLEHDSFPAQAARTHYTDRQRALSAKMDKLLAEIRALPGQKNFLLPPNEAELVELVRDSPIAIINTSAMVRRSDAILITGSGLEVLPLPLLQYGDARRRMDSVAEAVCGWTPRNMAAKNRQMREILLWLWVSTVRPVLDHLGFKEQTPGLRPRIHWIGTSILSFAPFHAAGDHSEGSTDNALHRVMSTYISTLRALSFAREQSSSQVFQHIKNNRRLLVVSAPDAPGAARLAAVEDEVACIARISAPHASVIQLKAAEPSLVLRELPLAHVVHLACHAVPDIADLSNGHLLLMPDTDESATPRPAVSFEPNEPDPAPEPGAGKLTVRQISGRRAPSAELAFLSACSTAAQAPCSTLADESVHIASAFQLAGFRNVVATMWQARDACCQEVAEGFYETLFDLSEGQARLQVPDALDQAVERLRRKNPERVLNWATFIHIGA